MTAATNFHSLPRDVRCLIYDLVKDKNDFLTLNLVSRATRYDMQKHYPEYKAELDAARRIELAWIKFKDRPVWQRAGLVCLCVLFSPVITVYYSPDIIRWASKLFNPRLKKLARMVGQAALQVLRWGEKQVQAAMNWTHQNILIPFDKAINWTAIKALEGLKWTYDKVLLPLGQAIKKAAQWTYNWVLTPIGHAVKNVFEHIIVPACRFAINRVIVPACRLANNYILDPTARFLVRTVVRIFKNILVPAAKGFLRAIKWTYNTIGIPAYRVIKAIAKGLLVTLPLKVYRHILTPIGHAIARVSAFIYTKVLVPLGNFLQFIYRNAMVPMGQLIARAARFVHEKVLSPLAQLTLELAHVIFIQLPVITWQFMTLQAETIRRML